MHLDTMSANFVSIKVFIMTNDSGNPKAVLKKSIELWIFESVLPRHHCNGIRYEHV